jgi:tetratricopeptide (TPR) repeat protein
MRSNRIATAWKVLVVCLLIVLSSAACDKFNSRDKIRQGNDAFKSGKYDTALAFYNQALQLDPGETKIYKNIGLAYMGMYQPGSKHPKDLEYAQKAIDNLKKYIETHPEDKRATEFLVTMYNNAGRMDEALAFYQGFLDKNPKDTKAMETMANLYFQKADFPHGVEMMERAMKVGGARKESYELIAAQAWDKAHNFPELTPEQRQGVITQGIEAANKALAIDPNYIEGLTYINLLYREQAKIETEPAKVQEDMAKADEYRGKALDLIKAKQAVAEKAKGTGAPTGATPSTATTAAPAGK